MLKNPDVKNVNKSKNRFTPAKLESKKQDKKPLTPRKGSGGASPSNIKKKPRPFFPFLEFVRLPHLLIVCVNVKSL